jgi:deoxyadenosine/deoxycytidine kinase
MADLKYEYIAIEGVIGAGKSTLATELSKKLGAKTIYEEFEDNPFLPLFYDDPKRYAFQLELSFLAARFHQLSGKENQADLFQPLQIADYWFDKCLLFAQNNLTEVEFSLYRNLFGIINPRLRQPDLVVYLHLSTERALHQITKRGRSYEQNITAQYLDDLSSRYLNHLKQQSQLKVLFLEAEKLDIVKHPEQLTEVIELLKKDYNRGINRITF